MSQNFFQPIAMDPQSNISTGAKTASYTLTASDDILTVDSDSDADGFTITLPDCASNPGKLYRIKRIGTTFATARAVVIAKAGSDTITDVVSGQSSVSLHTPGEEIDIVSFGSTVWQVVARRIPSLWTSYTPTGDWTNNVSFTGFWRRVGSSIEVMASALCAGAPNSATFTLDLPSGLTIDTAKLPLGADVSQALGIGNCNNAGSAINPVYVVYSTTTDVKCRYEDDTGTVTSTHVTEGAPFTFGASDSVILTFSAPIVDWDN